MNWTKIPTNLLVDRIPDKELVAIVKYQLLWAELEYQPSDETVLRYLTSNQLKLIKHWLNTIETQVVSDLKSVNKHRTHQKTNYQKKQQVKEKTDSQTDSQTDSSLTGNRLDKIRKENNINKFILKESLQSEPVKKTPKRFVKPTLEEVQAYCQERNNGVEPEKFINYYESKGWVVGKSPMKDWKAAVRTWEKSGYNQPKAEQPTQAGALPPPTLEEWLEFSDSLELDDDVMKKAYQYYQDADWYDRNGKKIFNWKQKIRAVWDKDENKIIKPRVFVID